MLQQGFIQEFRAVETADLRTSAFEQLADECVVSRDVGEQGKGLDMRYFLAGKALVKADLLNCQLEFCAVFEAEQVSQESLKNSFDFTVGPE